MNDCDGRSVEGLTRRGGIRRISGAARLSLVLRLLVSGFALSQGGAAMAGDAVAATQPVDEISQAAEDFLRQRIEGSGRQVTPRAGKLDSRLQLPRCDEGLEGYLPSGGKIGSRTVVGVRCGGSRPWKVYVPVDVVELRTVLVARRTLPQGHVLTAADLVSEERDVSRIVGGYLVDAELVVGQRLKRRLISGSVISAPILQEQVIIRRGQSVTLVVRDASLNISMAGTALMDGVQGERIRVENTASDRIVEGLVRSPQLVEVLVP